MMTALVILAGVVVAVIVVLTVVNAALKEITDIVDDGDWP